MRLTIIAIAVHQACQQIGQAWLASNQISTKKAES